jgi:alkylmercury lyase-like protein
MPDIDDRTVRDVRIALYRIVVDTGEAPQAAAVSAALGLDRSIVEHAYAALADAHVIVLEPGTADVRWAPPFSVVPTAFRVAGARSWWYAPCAWDAFGIPAALNGDAQIDARCGWSGEPIRCGVERGRAYGAGFIHLLVPAARFWDDIGYT